MDTRLKGWLVSDSGASCPLDDQADTIVGRTGCNLNFDEPDIGWKHATIKPPHDELKARYLLKNAMDKSTKVNGEEVVFRTAITPGDKIMFGATSETNESRRFTYKLTFSPQQLLQRQTPRQGPQPQPQPQLQPQPQPRPRPQPQLQPHFPREVKHQNQAEFKPTLRPVRSGRKGEQVTESIEPIGDGPVGFGARGKLQPVPPLSLKPLQKSRTELPVVPQKPTGLTTLRPSKYVPVYKKEHKNAQTQRVPTPTPTPTLMPMTDDGRQLYYEMKSEYRGLCLIIKSQNYMTHDLSDRHGAGVDVKLLTKVFKWLRFRVEIPENLSSAEEIQEEMVRVAQVDHSHFDCFVCVFLAHGKLIGVNGEEIPFESLIDPFNNDECVALRDKPKLFFVHACRGDLLQDADRRQDSKRLPDNRQGTARGSVDSDDGYSFKSIPRCADYLTCYATSYRYKATRNEVQGSIFIRVLCEELEKYGKKLDLHTILTIVNQRVSEMKVPLLKQMPQIHYTLTKLVKF